MRKMLAAFLGPVFLVALVVGLVRADEAPYPRPAAKEAVKIQAPAGPTAPPLIDGPAEAEFLATFTVTNLPKGAAVLWDLTPDGVAQTKEGECDGTLNVAGPPRAYRLKARVVQWDATAKTIRTKTLSKDFKLTGGKTDPKDDDKVDPGPPPPPPEPKVGVVKAFVVVEDTDKAGQWRGDILGSPKVAAFYKEKKLTHRLLSVGLGGADGALDAQGKEWLKRAEGKDLPWMFVVNDQNKIVRSVKANTASDDAFLTQLTGEAEFARAMGNLPPPENKTRAVFAKFGSAPNVPLIPRDQWKTVNLGAFLPPVYDQNGIGACNAFATCTVFEGCRAQAGLPYVKTSTGFLYGAINGGVDQGSFLEDALEWMQTVGTVKGTTVGPLDWRKGRGLKDNAAARSEAKSYKIVEAYECPTFAHMASALQQGFFINEGLMWYNNYTPGREGWLPAKGVGAAGGHALCGYGLAAYNGQWGILTRNSWSAQWGVGGNCIIPESCFDSRVGGFWAVRAVVQSDDAVPIPVGGSAVPVEMALRLDPFRGDRGFRHALAW